MGQPIRDLLENELCIGLLESALALDEAKEVATAGVFHDHEEVLAALEDLKEADDVRVLDFLKEVDLLKDLALRKIILHIRLLDRFDGHVLASEFVDPESDLTEGALADQLDELVVLESSRWQLIILLYVRLNELYQSVSLL